MIVEIAPVISRSRVASGRLIDLLPAAGWGNLLRAIRDLVIILQLHRYGGKVGAHRRKVLSHFSFGAGKV